MVRLARVEVFDPDEVMIARVNKLDGETLLLDGRRPYHWKEFRAPQGLDRAVA